MGVLTIGGEIELRRRYFWLKSEGGVFPADSSIGLALHKDSPAVREACCTMGVVQDFAQGAEDLHRLTGLRISKERRRQIREHIGPPARACLGEGNQAKAWAQQRLHDLKHAGASSLLAAIEMLQKKLRSADKLEALRR